MVTNNHASIITQAAGKRTNFKRFPERVAAISKSGCKCNCSKKFQTIMARQKGFNETVAQQSLLVSNCFLVNKGDYFFKTWIIIISCVNGQDWGVNVNAFISFNQ